MGGGVVILSQVLWINGHRYLTRNGSTPWDRLSGSHVTHGPVGALRGVSMAVIWIILDLLGYNLAGWFAQTFLFMEETSLQWPT